MTTERPSLVEGIPDTTTPTESTSKCTCGRPLPNAWALGDSLGWDATVPRNPTPGALETPGIPELRVDRLLAGARSHNTSRYQHTSSDAAFVRVSGPGPTKGRTK